MIVITLNAALESQEQATKVVEVFSRVMTGLAFDGIFITMNMQDVEITPSVGSEEEIGPS